MNQKMSKNQILTSALIVLCAFLLVFLAVLPLSLNAVRAEEMLASETVSITVKGMIEREYNSNTWNNSYSKTVTIAKNASFKEVYSTVYTDFIRGQSAYMYKSEPDKVYGRIGQFTFSGNDTRTWNNGDEITIFHAKYPKFYIYNLYNNVKECYYSVGNEIEPYYFESQYINHNFGDKIYFAGVVREGNEVTYGNLVPSNYKLQSSDNEKKFVTAYLDKSYIKFKVQVRSDWAGGETTNLGYASYGTVKELNELNAGNTATLSSYLSGIEGYTKSHQSLSACNFSHFEIDGAVATSYTMPTTGTTKEIVAVYKYVPYLYLHYPQVTKQLSFNDNKFNLSAYEDNSFGWLPQEINDTYFAGWSFVENGSYSDLITNKILQVEHVGKHVYATYLTYTRFTLSVDILDKIKNTTNTKIVGTRDGKYENNNQTYFVKNNEEFYWKQGEHTSSNYYMIFRTFLDSHRSLGGNYTVKKMIAVIGTDTTVLYNSDLSLNEPYKPLLATMTPVEIKMEVWLNDYILINADGTDYTAYFSSDTIDLATITSICQLPNSVTRKNSVGKDVELPFLGICNRQDGTQVDVDHTDKIVTRADKGKTFYAAYNDANAIPVRVYVDNTLSDMAKVWNPNAEIKQNTELVDSSLLSSSNLGFPHDAYNTTLDMTIDEAFNVQREHLYKYDNNADGKADTIYKSRYDYIYEGLAELYMRAFYPDDKIGTDQWKVHYPVNERFKLTFYDYDFLASIGHDTKLKDLQDKIVNIVVTKQDGYTVKFLAIEPDDRQIVGKVIEQQKEVYSYFAEPGSTIKFPQTDYTAKRMSIYLNGKYYYCDFQNWTLDRCSWKHWIENKTPLFKSECTSDTHAPVPTDYVINEDTVVYASCNCTSTSIIPDDNEGGNRWEDIPECTCGWCRILDKLNIKAPSFRKLVHMKDWSLSNIIKTFGKEPWFIIGASIICIILLAIFGPFIKIIISLLLLPLRAIYNATKKASNKVKKAGKRK